MWLLQNRLVTHFRVLLQHCLLLWHSASSTVGMEGFYSRELFFRLPTEKIFSPTYFEIENSRSRVWWYMPVISAVQEAEAGLPGLAWATV